MRRGLLQSSAFGFCAIGLSLLSQSAQANPVLPNLVNLNFVNFTGSNPKNTFGSVNPTGWTGGSGLIFIVDSSSSAADANSPCGTAKYLATWVCPTNMTGTIGAYNAVMADGNPDFESGFNYTVTGLTPGTTYDLSFFQAAGQQGPDTDPSNPSGGFSGATTEQWIVSLGTSGLTTHTCLSSSVNCSVVDSTHDGYANSDVNASIQATSLMNNASHGGVDWNGVTVSLKADATTDVLSFLAWGNQGSTVNLPPILFLTGVNSPTITGTPEPGSILLFGTVLLGVGGVIRRRRRAV